MKKNLIGIVLILVLLISGLTIYKLNNENTNIKEHYFKSFEIKKMKSDNEIASNDVELYEENIITENLYKINYNFFEQDKSITGSVYIGTDKFVYVYNENDDSTYRVSTVKFKTMYAKKSQYSSRIDVYLISENNEIYIMSLRSNDIKNVKISGYNYNKKFVNFLNIDIKYDMFKPVNTIFALAEDGEIYNINTGLKYNPDIMSIYNSIHIYPDKTMTDVFGRSIEDNEGNKYKIKYVFDAFDNDGFIEEKENLIAITEDNKFIYFSIDMKYVYEFDKKVKNVTFDVYYPYTKGDLQITFEDDYEVNFEASCNEIYCINKFAE